MLSSLLSISRRVLGSLQRLADDTGHTLAETTVAVALFVAVLIPAGALLGRLLTHPAAEVQIQALALAQMHVETLSTRVWPEAPLGGAEHEEAWSHGRLIRSTTASNGLVEVRVQVYREGRSEPIVTLTAARPAARPGSTVPWTLGGGSHDD